MQDSPKAYWLSEDWSSFSSRSARQYREFLTVGISSAARARSKVNFHFLPSGHLFSSNAHWIRDISSLLAPYMSRERGGFSEIPFILSMGSDPKKDQPATRFWVPRFQNSRSNDNYPPSSVLHVSLGRRKSYEWSFAFEIRLHHPNSSRYSFQNKSTSSVAVRLVPKGLNEARMLRWVAGRSPVCFIVLWALPD